MADTERTVDILLSLPFKNYDDDWVKSAWEKDFTDIDPLSLDLENDLTENDNHIEVLHKVCDVLDEWIREKEGPQGEGFWTVLVENNLSFKSFTAFLAYLMEVGHRKVANGQQRAAGLLAASCYFKLVTIPGSGAFKLFHPMLFQRGMDMLKSWTTLGGGGGGAAEKRKRQSSMSSSQAGRRGKRSRQNITVGVEIDEFSDEETEELTGPEINRIRRSILALLKDFIQLLDNFSLNQSESSGHYAITVLSELTKQDPELFIGRFDRLDASSSSMSALSYLGLLKLLSPTHGDVLALTTSVFKHLLPSLLMLIGDNKGVAASTIPKPIQVNKDHAVEFVCYLIHNHGTSVLPVVRTLIQHMCAKVPDKAEYRTKVAQSIIRLLNELPVEQFASMMEWIAKFSQNIKNSWRAFSLDVINLLILEPLRQPSDAVPEEKREFLEQTFLIEIIISRCSDIGPTVRARAIVAFAQCLSSGNTSVLEAVRNLVTPKPLSAPGVPPRLVPTPDINRAEKRTEQTDVASEENQSKDTTSLNVPPAGSTDTPGLAAITPSGAKRDTPVPIDLQTPTMNICLQDNKGMVSMLCRRVSDEKVMVRKAAIHALENVIKLQGASYKLQDLEVVKERTRDPALSVRRQAMQSLTDLLHHRPEDKQLQWVWLDGVLPVVMDRETSAQDRCLEILEEIFLHNIVPSHRTKQAECGLVWDLLDILAGDGGVELRRFLQKACQLWNRAGKIKGSVIPSLQTHVNTDNDAGAWLLLSELAPSASKFKHQFVLEYWNEKAKVCEANQYSTCQRVLTVIGYIAKSLNREDRTSLIDDLKSKLLAFEFPPELVTATVSTLSKLCETEGEIHSQKEEWCTELLMACDNFLSGVILNENQFDIPNEDKVVRHLFTLGEIAQLCPANTPKRVFILVQSLIAAPCLSDSPNDSSTAIANTDQESTHADPLTNTDVSPEISINNSQPKSQSTSQVNSQTSSQASQGPRCSQFSQSSQILSQFRGSKMSNKIRAHAFITLGKLCLQNEDVAKKCVSALARELAIAQDPSIRNNVVVILCDLCVRYTTLVDRYVVNIAACLKDDSALVRKQTLTLLTRLLQEDFLKWKGVLFFRFITSLLDECKEISSLAEFCLIHLLLQRNPKMFFHHLVECVFHFNGYEDHSVYNKFQQTDREKQMFSLKGVAYFSKRMKLYKFMLEHMEDDQRFKLTAKLCQDILGGVVDNIIPLTAESSVLLQDTLCILCLKEIKLASLRTKAVDDGMDEQDMAAAVMDKAKKTLITQVVKKNVIENIVPIVISLKLILEQHRSPVLKYLMFYLRELMKDYKDEVQEILAGDRQLATEIEYDLRTFEEKEKRQEQAQTPSGSPRVAGSRPGSPAVTKSPSGGSKTGSPKAASPGADASPQPSVNGSPTAPGSMPCTPRPVSMSTLAILNSAKKAMEQGSARKSLANQRSLRKSIANRSRLSKAPTTNVQTEERCEQEENTRQAAPITMLFKTPDHSVKRAISTPSSVLGNITFHQDQNITLVPPSPIPSSLPIRLYGDAQTSSDSSPCRSVSRGGNPPSRDMVYMFSPDQPLPKPRSWKVSVTPKGKTDSGPKRGDNQENVGDKAQAASDESPKRKTSGRVKRRSLRLQYS